MLGVYSEVSTSKGGSEDPDPWIYRGKIRRWISMIICTIACAFTSGPVMAYPTLEPLLQAQGLFTSSGESKNETEDLYNLAYTIACAAMFFVSLPAGIMYDYMGGRATGVYGALFSSLGLFFMFIATSFPVRYGWIFFIGYPLATGSGMLNQNCLYTFMWLLPESANLISGIAMGAQALSDMLALVAVYLKDNYEISVSYFLLGLCLMNVVAALVLQYYVPSKKFYLDEGRKLSAALGYVEPMEEDSLCTKLSKAVRVACKRPSLISLIMAFSSVYFVALIIPMQSMLYYYEDLWPAPILSSPSKIASFLVNTFALVYGVGGFVSSVFGGMLCDKTGIRYFTLAVAACAVISNVLLLIKNENSQVVAEVILTFGGNLYGIIITRYCVLYTPPELFGSCSGIIFTLLSFGMTLVYALLMFIMNELNISSALINFQVQFLLLGLVSSILALALADYWRTYPPPHVGNETISSLSSDIEMTTSSNYNENTELLNSSTRNSFDMNMLTSFEYREYVALRMILLIILLIAFGTFMHSVYSEMSDTKTS